MVHFKLSTILDVLGHAVMDPLTPARVDVLVPCECISQIEEELLPIILTEASPRVTLFGEIELEDGYRTEAWSGWIMKTSSFQDFVAHLNDRHKDEIVYAEHEISAGHNRRVKPVKNPFAVYTNQRKIADAIYEAMREDPDRPVPRLVKAATDEFRRLLDPEKVMSEMGSHLSELVEDCMKNTGLDFNTVVGTIKPPADKQD